MTHSEFLEKLSKLTQEDLENVKGLGPILASNFVEFTSSQNYKEIAQKFAHLEQNDSGFEVLLPNKKNTQGPLSGKNICITGTFDMPRLKIKEKLESLGAKTQDQVNKSTNILFAGQNAGSKLEKAINLGVEIIHEQSGLDDFLSKYS